MKSLIVDMHIICDGIMNSEKFANYKDAGTDPILSTGKKIYFYICKYGFSSLQLLLAGLNLFIADGNAINYIAALANVIVAFITYKSSTENLGYCKIADGLLRYQYLIDRYNLNEYLKFLIRTRSKLDKDPNLAPYYLIDSAYKKFNMQELYDKKFEVLNRSKIKFNHEILLIIKLFLVEYYPYTSGNKDVLENRSIEAIEIAERGIDILIKDLKRHPGVIKRIKKDLISFHQPEQDREYFSKWLDRLFE